MINRLNFNNEKHISPHATTAESSLVILLVVRLSSNDAEIRYAKT